MKTKLKKVKYGRKTVKVYHDNFNYYQPNDHVCGDCSIRAVSSALNVSWLTAYDKLCAAGRKIFDTPSSTETVGAVLLSEGFVWHPVIAEAGSSRPLVHEFAEKHKTGKYVLRVSNHLVAAKDGKYHDIWDCGEKSLYGYWEKK